MIVEIVSIVVVLVLVPEVMVFVIVQRLVYVVGIFVVMTVPMEELTGRATELLLGMNEEDDG